MKRQIIYKWHRDNSTGFISIRDTDSPTKIIEQGQRNMAAQGFATGITWQVIEGNIVDAMVACANI